MEEVREHAYAWKGRLALAYYKILWERIFCKTVKAVQTFIYLIDIIDISFTESLHTEPQFT